MATIKSVRRLDEEAHQWPGLLCREGAAVGFQYSAMLLLRKYTGRTRDNHFTGMGIIAFKENLKFTKLTFTF